MNVEVQRRRNAEAALEMYRNVTTIPKRELLKRAVGSARDRNRRHKHPRWVGVMWCFALGRTYANQLCELYGFNPDEEVK